MICTDQVNAVGGGCMNEWPVKGEERRGEEIGSGGGEASSRLTFTDRENASKHFAQWNCDSWWRLDSEFGILELNPCVVRIGLICAESINASGCRGMCCEEFTPNTATCNARPQFLLNKLAKFRLWGYLFPPKLSRIAQYGGGKLGAMSLRQWLFLLWSLSNHHLLQPFLRNEYPAHSTLVWSWTQVWRITRNAIESESGH